MDTDFLDWALADFSGYVAADELYDGPFCMLSAVDNRRYKRLLYDVLDHDPTHEDIRAFLGRLKTALTARDLTLLGITTDGSALYPVPLAEVFGGVRHQLCAFHIVADVAKRCLGAVASARKGLAAKQPKLPRGRPSTPAAKQAARTKKRLDVQRAALFTHRYLFVQRHLSKTERKTLWRITGGCPSYRSCVRSWNRSTRCLIDAVGPRPRSTNSPPCGGACSGSRRWATPSRSSFPPRWRKLSRFLTTSYCLRPRMRWSGVTGAIARCKRVSIGCGRKRRSVRVLRWICGVKPKLKAVNKPLHHFIVHGLDKPGSSATVSLSSLSPGVTVHVV